MKPGVRSDAGAAAVCPEGDWTLSHYVHLSRLIDTLSLNEACPVDLRQLGRLDTAGAALLVRALGRRRLIQAVEDCAELPAEQRDLLLTLSSVLEKEEGSVPDRRRQVPGLAAIVQLGRSVENGVRQSIGLLSFIGLLLVSACRAQAWRPAPLVNQIEQTGLRAIPIIVVLTFAVGTVVAFLGASVLVEFGATIYIVDLIGYAMLREFGVLLAAIVLAGRTASAFTVQLGSMKANEELDAMRAQGLDPVARLVVPRLIALVLVLPLLSFIATLAGLAGGAVVAVFVLDISLPQFLAMLNEIPPENYWVGLLKAPLFALVIAAIGCREGLKAGASAQSVGEHTTSSVVQSIFAVILLDAVAALFFMEVGW
ncbi:ABC transporter permease [Alkalilimnicola ehrlichii]|uniref:ABC transporter permease n=1 Tax=Alkalilimnicola ehrlichii TaxID=351052 RepID=A0A3E0X4K8_9GAMM|nr:ABC transporter permease [Alkalilimnicola ehrlichii]RFA39625.1 ABC transporter permease [Alkalilimnicola ehrlichii]